ncbi:MAG: NADH-quinone oxidoreductase subunit NuoH [Sciscionella sp.]|nr:NADH-quinone oxidoreductase subunit NuoH [Sciscionella sp.]
MSDTERLLAGDPLWLVIIKVVAIFAFLMVAAMLAVWGERRLIGKMQHRPGPNRVGPFGLLQALADGLKVAFKEDIRPLLADKAVFVIAPILSAVPAFLAMSVMPFGPEVSIFGHHTVLQIADLPVGILVVLACSSVGVYGLVLSGWASGTPYPLLSSLRAAAQVISYEIAMGLSVVGTIIYSHTLSTAGIVDSQSGGWYFWLLPVSFVIYAISMVGETNRAPFDLPEAESELVGGYHTEYSSLKFVMFYIAEYINMIVVASFMTTLFLGGWRAPWPLSLWAGANSGWWPLLWFLAKVTFIVFCFIWVRATLPRLRYDQFMRLGWKVLVPVNLLWITLVVALRETRLTYGFGGKQILIFGGIVVVVLIVIALLMPDRRVSSDVPEVPLAGSGHPIPPLDLSIPRQPSRKSVAAGKSTRRRRASVGTQRDSLAESSSREGTDGNV